MRYGQTLWKNNHHQRHLGPTIGYLLIPRPSVLSLVCAGKKISYPECICNYTIIKENDRRLKFFNEKCKYLYMPVVSRWVSSCLTQDTFLKVDCMQFYILPSLWIYMYLYICVDQFKKKLHSTFDILTYVIECHPKQHFYEQTRNE